MVMEVGKTKLCRVGQHAGDLGSGCRYGAGWKTIRSESRERVGAVVQTQRPFAAELC